MDQECIILKRIRLFIALEEYYNLYMKAFQLKITLRDQKPPIWRRVIVKQNIKFAHLHNIIQEIFEWENYHLHSFTVKNPDKIGLKDEEQLQLVHQLNIDTLENIRKISSVVNDTIQIGDPRKYF